MGTVSAILLVFLGCCSNVVSLELLVREFPGCGNIVTFAQFVFIALEGFVFETRLGTKKPAIPISNYVIMVTMFFTVSVINNYALNFNIAMPLHMIFRSGSLIANMVLGIVLLKKRYSPSKYLSIAFVSAGIFICTIMSAKQVNVASEGQEERGLYAFMRWLVGIGMLTFALIMSARMGIFQETLYKKYGKHSKEALFYNHFLPLPGFLLLSTDIYNHCVLFSQSTPVLVPLVQLNVPVMWLYLLVNVVTQYPFLAVPPGFPARGPCLPLTAGAQVRVHPRRVHPDHRVRLAHRHPGGDSEKVPQPHLLHRVLPKPLHGVALGRHGRGLRGHAALHRGVERRHGGQEEGRVTALRRDTFAFYAGHS
ncbi:UDP-xylose and UDP-N-acetylglucosamine transporter isoform X1 [Hippocampus comes]|uniref:UDP-xylose and UDP-N-acetylglucosamine transporter isoform X1 n=1 Tax=Hippocampus comes TaxID=109280 RepID=UPI00094E04DB|nr:PREDICTED: UDP-xylose and UDP-N-acetylglucosamine transporter isoform X1 [Hippocampus comes]